MKWFIDCVENRENNFRNCLFIDINTVKNVYFMHNNSLEVFLLNQIWHIYKEFNVNKKCFRL